MSLVRLVTFFAYSAICLPIIMIAVLLRPGTDFYYRVARYWIRGILGIFGVRLDVHGADKLVPGGDYVLLSNHRSQLDPIAIGVGLLHLETRWVAKKELRKVPVFGRALQMSGQIFIDRQDHEQAVRALQRHLADRGVAVCFFPEGHRGPGRGLLPFKRGGAAFAISAGLPVVPIALSGSERCLPRGSLYGVPGVIHVVIGDPIDVTKMTEADRGPLTDRVRADIERMLARFEDIPAEQVAARAVSRD